MALSLLFSACAYDSWLFSPFFFLIRMMDDGIGLFNQKWVGNDISLS